MLMFPDDETGLLRLWCRDFKAYGNKVLAALEQSVKEDDALQIAPVNHEGVSSSTLFRML